VAVDEELPIRRISVPADPREYEGALGDLWDGLAEELACSTLGFYWDLVFCEGDGFCEGGVGVGDVAVAWVFVDEL
jgi:hypothetical protein